MASFIRSSSLLFHCTKRMLSAGVAIEEGLNKVIPKTHKIRKIGSVESITRADDLLINKKLRSNEPIEGKEWISIREELMKKFGLSETNVDSRICDLCSYYNDIEQAAYYLKYLKQNNYEMHLNMKSIYLKIFYARHRPITPEEEDEIIQIYEELKKEYDVLDPVTSGNCILALSLTKKWKESFKLLEMMELITKPGATVAGAIICAAFRNNKPSLAWKLMNQYVSAGFLHSSVYTEYLNYCNKYIDKSKLQEEIDKMFLFWRENDLSPAEFVIKEYTKVYQSFGYDYNYTSISKKGQCQNCHSTFPKTSLNTTDFKLLAAALLKNTIVGENVYKTSSPQELKRYMLFIQTMRPFDVVIDGLNVAYAARKANGPASLSNVLQLVNYFTKSKQRVLVVGRAHMNWWSKETMGAIRSKAEVFLTKNLSEDDPYMLHIALTSGPQTHFVSRDLMRQHKFKINDPKLQILFKRWQMSRQYFFIKNKVNSSITLIPPAGFEINTQQNERGWHIPYTKSLDLMIPVSYSLPENWLCLRKHRETNMR